MALENLHGIQPLHVAAVPRGQPVEVGHLRMDDGQVVDERSMYKARS